MKSDAFRRSFHSPARRDFATSLRSFLLSLSLLSLVAASANAATPAKFEPARGCYIGAFIERNDTVHGNIGAFEKLTGKKHASYFTYVGYGCPFPGDWVAKVKAQGAAPHIAFEPNHGLGEVKDDAYLRAWARDAARTRTPIFLRWASEMNGPWCKYSGDPELYKEKFRLVCRVMREEAPNVAMVWTPFAEPTRLIPPYYPGDEWVDWVGVNIYSVYVNNGDPLRKVWDKDPLEFLRFIYETYAARKPIHISEFAATVQCKGTGYQTADFAIEKMTRFYNGLRLKFPRVKSVNYFCLDAIGAGLANNNYSFLQQPSVLSTYSQMVSNAHFLSRVAFDPAAFAGAIKSGTTIGARGLKMRPSTPEDEMLSGAGSVAATLDEPRLRGVQNGEIVSDDLELSAQLPLDLSPHGLLWQIDGQTAAITNTLPYRVSLARDRFAPGPHTARVVVLGQGNARYPSPPVAFEFAPD